MSAQDDFEVRFTDREITAWGGMALMQKMLQSIRFSDAAKQWDLPQPGSNRGYEPVQIIEQFMVSIWCGANRFAHAEITRLAACRTYPPDHEYPPACWDVRIFSHTRRYFSVIISRFSPPSRLIRQAFRPSC
jgi:hypothetical protein